MISLLSSLGRKSLALLAVLIVCLLPTAGRAESVTIKNTTAGPLVIQFAYVGPGGRVMQSRQVPVAAGATTPALPIAGNKQIFIWDPTAPTRPLLKQAMPGTVQDQFWDIATGNNPKIPIQLVPGTAPKP